MLKILFFVVYFGIGLFFMSQVLGICLSPRFEKVRSNNRVSKFSACVTVCLLEFFLWPIMIIVTAGFKIGKDKYEEEYPESDEPID